MAFHGLNFIFNGISNSTYNIQIVNFDSSGLANSNLGGGIKPVYDQIRRKHNVMFYGSQPSEPLEFELTFATDEYEIDAYSINAISRWLFGHQSFGWLQIEQSSYEGLWFYCMLLDPQIISVGNINIGFKCKVFCNSSYVYTDEITSSYNINTSQSITFNNLSDADLYLYPTVQFVTSSTTTSFSITNQTDNNRVFSFTGVSGNETISVDNEKQIITSSTGLNRLSKFNLNFFRLLSGFNSLVVNGSGTLSITARFLKKIGG